MHRKTHTAIEGLHAVTHAAALAGLALTPVWGSLASWGYLAAGVALFALVAVLSAPVAWGGMLNGYAHHVATRRRENALRDLLDAQRAELDTLHSLTAAHGDMLKSSLTVARGMDERFEALEAWARTTQRTVDAARSERNAMRDSYTSNQLSLGTGPARHLPCGMDDAWAEEMERGE